MLIELPQNIEKQVNMMAELQGKTSEQIVIEIVEKQFAQRVERPFDYDLDEIKRSIESGFKPVPKFDTAEELANWLGGAK